MVLLIALGLAGHTTGAFGEDPGQTSEVSHYKALLVQRFYDESPAEAITLVKCFLCGDSPVLITSPLSSTCLKKIFERNTRLKNFEHQTSNLEP